MSNAEYGQYFEGYGGFCLAPNPMYDCTEIVEENSPPDWLYLLSLCDNQTSCSYEYRGSVIDECEVGYVADYMLITYDCNPGKGSCQTFILYNRLNA